MIIFYKRYRTDTLEEANASICVGATRSNALIATETVARLAPHAESSALRPPHSYLRSEMVRRIAIEAILLVIKMRGQLAALLRTVHLCCTVIARMKCVD